MMETNPNAALRLALAQKGITNGLKLARFLNSPGVIFFFRGQDGWADSRAELRLLDVGDRISFEPEEGEVEVRRACVDKAMETGSRLLEVEGWSRAPYSNCWLPQEDVSRLHDMFAEKA